MEDWTQGDNIGICTRCIDSGHSLHFKAAVPSHAGGNLH